MALQQEEEAIMKLLEWLQENLRLPKTTQGFILYILLGMLSWQLCVFLFRALLSVAWPTLVMTTVVIAAFILHNLHPELFKIVTEFFKIIFVTMLYVVARFFEIQVNAIRFVLSDGEKDD